MVAEIDRDLHGRTACVTGANSGLGLETARSLARRGATVIIACRDLSRAEEAVSDIRKSVPNAKLQIRQLNLSNAPSIRDFARGLSKDHQELSLLVNNAGANYVSTWSTEEGVPGLVQVNYLGPYLLTRLLEPQLKRGRARVVNVSSIMHRFAFMPDPTSFLTRASRQNSANSASGKNAYARTKLANVLFTYELSRRWHGSGVEACAVDPGGVSTNIWRHSKALMLGPVQFMLTRLYAPASDAAQGIVHAATAPLQAVPASGKSGPLKQQAQVFGSQRHTHFFARGAFAWPVVQRIQGFRPGMWGRLQGYADATAALAASFVDWPVRRLSGGAFLGHGREVQSSPRSYDEALGRMLWDASADVLKLPH